MVKFHRLSVPVLLSSLKMPFTNCIFKICGEQFSEVDILKLPFEFMHEEVVHCSHYDYQAHRKYHLRIHIESKHEK